MTKDEYFAAVRKNPWSFPSSVTSDLPREWVAEAWDLPEVQNEVVSGSFIRDVSKTGSLCLSGDYLARLAAALSSAQVAKLYLDIREKTLTREREFRPEFLTWFAQHKDAIPPEVSEAELADRLGFDSVEEMNQEFGWQQTEGVPPEPGDPNNPEDIPF